GAPWVTGFQGTTADVRGNPVARSRSSAHTYGVGGSSGDLGGSPPKPGAQVRVPSGPCDYSPPEFQSECKVGWASQPAVAAPDCRNRRGVPRRVGGEHSDGVPTGDVHLAGRVLGDPEQEVVESRVGARDRGRGRVLARWVWRVHPDLASRVHGVSDVDLPSGVHRNALRILQSVRKAARDHG